MGTVKREPGIWRGIPMAEYHTLDAISNSRLVRLQQSPAHLRAYIEEPHKETPALTLGRAIHYAVLEPDQFEAAYRCGPEGDRRKKDIREKWAAMIAEFGDGYVLRPDDWQTCLRVRDSVHASRSAHGLLAGDGDVELSCVWKDLRTGLLCKGRMDRHSPLIAGGAIVDLKTTRDASPRNFRRAIWTYGYYMQGAHYLSGAQSLGLPVEHYTIIAVEKEPPYAVAVYRFTEPVIEAGNQMIRPLLDIYAKMNEIPMQDWPAYPDEVRDIDVPDWAWRLIGDDALQLQQEAIA